MPFAIILPSGVLVALSRGVDGSDLTVGDGFEAVDLVVGVALAATRGVTGVRVVRFEARAGFSGRFALVDRSVDIRPVAVPFPAQPS